MGVVTKKSGRRTKATFVEVGFAALVVIGVALAFAFTQGQATGASATAPQTTQQMTLIGASTIHSTPLGSGAVANPETIVGMVKAMGLALSPDRQRRCCRSPVCNFFVIEDATASHEPSQFRASLRLAEHPRRRDQIPQAAHFHPRNLMYRLASLSAFRHRDLPDSTD